jgi:localization factor PodJL
MAAVSATPRTSPLDDLARRSDERNTKTSEAIHDTPLKIVDRLG